MHALYHDGFSRWRGGEIVAHLVERCLALPFLEVRRVGAALRPCVQCAFFFAALLFPSAAAVWPVIFWSGRGVTCEQNVWLHRFLELWRLGHDVERCPVCAVADLDGLSASALSSELFRRRFLPCGILEGVHRFSSNGDGFDPSAAALGDRVNFLLIARRFWQVGVPEVPSFEVAGEPFEAACRERCDVGCAVACFLQFLRRETLWLAAIVAHKSTRSPAENLCGFLRLCFTGICAVTHRLPVLL